MDESTIIKKVLNLNFDENETISTLALSLRGARELTQRNVETGEFIEEFDIQVLDRQIENLTYVSNKLIGLASYLIIIDLIGNILKKKGESESEDDFKQTLNHFTELHKHQKKSLKNLRNSLAHKFSLGNESEVFILDYSSESTELIENASEIYPSPLRIKQKEDKNFTTVYYNSVCNLVEDIYKKIINLNKENEIEILSKYKNGNVIKIHDFNSMYFVR